MTTRFRLGGFGALAGVGDKKCSLLHARPHQPWDRHGRPYNGYWDYFPVIKQPGVTLATHPLLGPKLNNRVVPVLRLCAVKTRCRETFTLLTITTLSRPVVLSNVPENEFWIVKGRCEPEKIFITICNRCSSLKWGLPSSWLIVHNTRRKSAVWNVECEFVLWQAWAAVTVVWTELLEALCCKPESRRFDSEWGHWDFLLT